MPGRPETAGTEPLGDGGIAAVDGPLSPAALDQIERRLAQVDRRRDPASTARRIEAAAMALADGRPEAELCELIAALALWCRYQCILRDQGRPTRVAAAPSTRGART